MKSAHPIIAILKAERRRQRLTLQQLGERLGRKTPQSVYKWENGSDIRLSNLEEWAGALGMRLTLTPGGDE